MKKTICRALLCLLLAACLLPLTARTAHADKIYDEISSTIRWTSLPTPRTAV